MRPEDEIWNRACSEAGGPRTLTAPGDRALANMVLAHSLAMNGGVLHAIESLGAEERAAAFDAYRYFGLDAAAHVLEDIARRWDGDHLDLGDAERLEIEADERYAIAVADDDALVRAFATRYGQNPSAFAALD